MIASKIDSDFLRYLVTNGCRPGDRLPPLEKLKARLGLSMSKLREQLEVARHLGLVEIKPRSGIHCAEYTFLPAIKHSVLFALALDNNLFSAFSALRHHVEVSFFPEAVAQLTDSDKTALQDLIITAQRKLAGTPIRIPHQEHRALHLGIFQRLKNPFVQGLMEAYWDAYEAVELNVYADINYLREVWDYHAQIVAGIINGDIDSARRALVEHTELLRVRDASPTRDS
jgi:DNA-binding FadR family transcriptional regulator